MSERVTEAKVSDSVLDNSTGPRWHPQLWNSDNPRNPMVGPVR